MAKDIIEIIEAELSLAKSLVNSINRRLEAAKKESSKKQTKFNSPNRFATRQLKKAHSN